MRQQQKLLEEFLTLQQPYQYFDRVDKQLLELDRIIGQSTQEKQSQMQFFWNKNKTVSNIDLPKVNRKIVFFVSLSFIFIILHFIKIYQV